MGPRVVALTRDKDGAVISMDGQVAVAEGIDMEAVDPTGAGDTLAAALCVGLQEGMPLMRLAAFCNSAGTLVIIGYEGGLMALNDRLKLRSMVVGEKGETVYIASEECAIRVISPELDTIWAPRGGEPVIVNLNNGGNK